MYKELYIYQKDNSITTEICEDIIEMFEKNLIINPDLDNQMKYNEYIVTNDKNLTTINYNIRFDDIYNKIKKTLTIELDIHLRKLFCKINTNMNIIPKNNYNIKYNILSIHNQNNYDFNIQSKLYNRDVEIDNTIISKKNDNIYHNRINIFNQKIKYFHYIWFLNDYETNLIFWDNYPIQIKKGKLIIFPVSWCFPYNEILNLNKLYTIYGIIESV